MAEYEIPEEFVPKGVKYMCWGNVDHPSEDEYERAKLKHLETFEGHNKLMDEIASERANARDLTKLEREGMVDKWYEMNPEIEGLIYSGTELEVGMVVLLENPEMRVDIREVLSDEELFRARRTNRWALISRIEFKAGRVIFLGEFEDGVQSKLEIDANESWICKLRGSAVGTAQVPGQTSIDEGEKEDGRIQYELDKLRKEDFGV